MSTARTPAGQKFSSPRCVEQKQQPARRESPGPGAREAGAASLMSTTHENYGDLHGNRAYGEDYNTPTEGTDDRMLFLDGCVLSDPATWDGTGSGAKALYGQYMQQRNALGDAHVLPVQCGGSDCSDAHSN